MITTFNKIINKLQVLENGHLLSNHELSLLKENFELIWEVAKPSVKQIENKLRGNVRPPVKISKRWAKLHDPQTTYKTQEQAMTELLERLDEFKTPIALGILNRILKNDF